MAIILVARTSKMTHFTDCEWVVAQERNSNLHFTKYDSTVDTEWFASRARDLTLAELLDRPRPKVCDWCGCHV